MGDSSLDDFLEENGVVIIGAVQARMRGDETMLAIAAQRGLGESALVGQVLGFWLKGIRTDLMLGSTVALSQSMGWLTSLRAGHALPFDDALVGRMFEELSDEIEVRLPAGHMREEYTTYRQAATAVIADAFPGRSETEA